MLINHVNLPVTDVPKAKTFLETYFGLRAVHEDSETIVVMLDASGNVVTLSNFKKADEVVYPGAFHIGFMQKTREDVDAIFERLTTDGFEVGPRKDFHGAWTFYFKPPGGSFAIEVGHQYAMG